MSPNNSLTHLSTSGQLFVPLLLMNEPWEEIDSYNAESHSDLDTQGKTEEKSNFLLSWWIWGFINKVPLCEEEEREKMRERK